MNLPDQDAMLTASNAVTPSQDVSVATDSTADYVPHDGDVVRLKYKSKSVKAIIFTDKDDDRIALFDNTKWDYFPGVKDCEMVKVDETDLFIGEIGISAALIRAKAYFAKAKAFTPDPGKSYADNQAAWVEFHGLKAGSRVKVVRKETDSVPWNINGRMDATIGMTGTMFEAGIYSLRVAFSDDSVWAYQYECLEPVK